MNGLGLKTKTNWHLKFFSYGKSSSSVRFQSLYNTGCSINLLRTVQLDNREGKISFCVLPPSTYLVVLRLHTYLHSMILSPSQGAVALVLILKRKLVWTVLTGLQTWSPPLYGFFHRRMLLKEIWSTNLIQDGWDCRIFFPCDLWIAIDCFDKLPVLRISACMSSTLAEDELPQLKRQSVYCLLRTTGVS